MAFFWVMARVDAEGPEMEYLLDDGPRGAQPRILRARFLVDQAFVTEGLIRLLPEVEPRPGDAEIITPTL